MIVKTKIQAHPLAKSRLIWMRDNQPSLLLELHTEGKLQQQIITDVSEAVQAYLTMVKEGTDPHVASEYMLDRIAPAEGMESSRQRRKIPDKAFKKIVNDVMRG